MEVESGEEWLVEGNRRGVMNPETENANTVNCIHVPVTTGL